MFELEFNQAVLEQLAAHRSDFWTTVFQAITFMGGAEGYLLVIALIYTLIDKGVAVRASIVVLFTMITNHLLKTIIHNPRPFTVDGTYTEMWAVSSSRAADLAAEFSTPSGHAMAAAAFYSFLVGQTTNTAARVGLVVAFLLIGISRPILGVHYIEDVVLGWLLGISVAVLAHFQWENVWRRWCATPLSLQVAIVVSVSVLVWVATILIDDRQISDLPTGFVSILGFLSGVLLVAPVEAARVGHQPTHGSWGSTWSSFLLMVFVLMAALLVFDWLTEAMGIGNGVYEAVWRYLRYALIGGIGMLLVPWLFVHFRLSSARRIE